MNAAQQEIVERFERAGKRGLSSDHLLGLLYDRRSDGGPITARKSMHVRIWRINKHLKKEGRAIRATNGGGPGGACGVYRIIKFNE